MHTVLKILPTVLFSIVVGSCSTLFAQDSLIVVAKLFDSVDVCGNRRAILEVVANDQIYFADSLYGFDLDISYDPEKFIFSQPLESGTLAGQISTSEFKYYRFNTPGILGVTYFRTNKYVGGSNVLARIEGVYTKQCSDTAEIKILLFDPQYDFGTKISRNFSTWRATIAQMHVKKSPDRELASVLQTKDIVTKDSTFIQKLTIPIRKVNLIDSVLISFTVDSVSIRDWNIESVDDESHVSQLIYAGNNASAVATSKNRDAINLAISGKLNFGLDTVAVIQSTVSALNKCHCITGIQNGDFSVTFQKPKDSVIISVMDSDVGLDGNVEYQINENRIVVRGIDNCEIVELMVFDLSGEVAESKQLNRFYEKNVELDISDLNTGVYFVKVVTNAGIVVKKLLRVK